MINPRNMDEKRRPKRILLVEDEESLADMIRMNLEMEGYDVGYAKDGKEALDIAGRERFDACVLDIMLPEIDGITVCKTLRAQDIGMPILFLSAKSSGADRVEGLKSGGDDYLTKPFNLEELLLRVRNLVRQSRQNDVSTASVSSPKRFSFGPNEIDFVTFEVRGHDGKMHTLSKREIEFLRFLIDHENAVVSREEILNTVWGYDVFPSTRTIDNYILAFRRYFERDSRKPRYFHSIRGVGYKFTS